MKISVNGPRSASGHHTPYVATLLPMSDDEAGKIGVPRIVYIQDRNGFYPSVSGKEVHSCGKEAMRAGAFNTMWLSHGVAIVHRLSRITPFRYPDSI